MKLVSLKCNKWNELTNCLWAWQYLLSHVLHWKKCFRLLVSATHYLIVLIICMLLIFVNCIYHWFERKDEFNKLNYDFRHGHSKLGHTECWLRFYIGYYKDTGNAAIIILRYTTLRHNMLWKVIYISFCQKKKRNPWIWFSKLCQLHMTLIRYVNRVRTV